MVHAVSRKARYFWPIGLSLLLADCTTKDLAVAHLSPAHVPHDILGDWIRLTLTYNSGGAMGLTLGSYSRVGFGLLAMAALVVLGSFYRAMPANAVARAVALAAIAAGAVGNLLDRIRSPRGVIDLIDVGFGPLRFWTFNLADAAITIGAGALAWALWRSSRQSGAT